MASINFFSEDTSFQLPHPRKTSTWIKKTVISEKKILQALNYIFCSDEFLHKMNVQYLNHKTYTDIITFNQSDHAGVINGEIYISIDRVKENASTLKIQFDTELHRVIIHGALHLLGYNDKTVKEKAKMRKKEDAYLSLRKN